MRAELQELEAMAALRQAREHGAFVLLMDGKVRLIRGRKVPREVVRALMLNCSAVERLLRESCKGAG